MRLGVFGLSKPNFWLLSLMPFGVIVAHETIAENITSGPDPVAASWRIAFRALSPSDSNRLLSNDLEL